MNEYIKKDNIINAIFFSIAMVAIFVLNQTIAGSILWDIRKYSDGAVLLLSGIFSLIVYTLIISFKQKQTRRKRIKPFIGFEAVVRSDKRSSALLVVGGYGIMLLWLFLLSSLYGRSSFIKEMFNTYGRVEEVLFGGGNIAVTLFYGSILGPIVEELLFRALVQGRLRQAMSNRAAIVISALAFGIIHLNLIQGVYAFIIGMFFGIIYERTNSIKIPILGHILVNSIAQITSYFELMPLMLVVGIISIVCAVPALIVAKRWFKDIGENDTMEIDN